MSCTNCGSIDIFCKNICRKCYDKEYREKNKEKKQKRDKKYQQTKNGKKSYRKASWRHQGLIDSDNDNYQKIYQRWLDTTHCDLCNIELTEDQSNTQKEMEHCHKTGLFRNIVCRICNNKIRVQEMSSKSNTGIKNITYNKSSNTYQYKKMIDGERYEKNFNTIGEALAHKIIHNVLLNRSI